MQYSNPLPQEGINTTATHPLKEFALLAGGLLGIGVVVILLLGLFADRVVQYIPFEAETLLASSYKDIPGSQQGATQQYLQHLADYRQDRRIVGRYAYYRALCSLSGRECNGNAGWSYHYV